MTDIKLLYELKDQFDNVNYEEKDKFYKYSKRFEMLTKKFFGEHSKYLQDFNILNAYPSSIYSTLEQKQERFNSIKSQCIALIETMIEELELDNLVLKPPSQVINQNKNTKVFIVHGRDDLTKEQVARYLERLGLEAIILHEKEDSGQTIIEKLEKNTDVSFAVVLYTACDMGKYKDDNDYNKRARQNVIFEHGYLIAKIGRKNVLALVKDNVEQPSDIAGVVYTKMDSEGVWKYRLAKELQSSNFDVDMNKILT